LETPVSGEDEDQTLAQLIEDQDSVSVFEQLAVVDTSNAVSDVLKELTPKEERVIRMRFGIGVQEESTLEDIGLKLGVTRERIRQIEAKTLKKLAGNELGQRLREAFH
jgi:RNA polymerase primary sigma factor